MICTLNSYVCIRMDVCIRMYVCATYMLQAAVHMCLRLCVHILATHTPCVDDRSRVGGCMNSLMRVFTFQVTTHNMTATMMVNKYRCVRACVSTCVFNLV